MVNAGSDAGAAAEEVGQDDARLWEEHTDPATGSVYLMNSETHETRWL